MLCQGIPSTAQDLSVQPGRTEMVGYKYHLDATSETSVVTTTTVAGRPSNATSETIKYELSADVITLATAPDKWATRKRFVVLASKIIRGEQSAPILPAGTIVEVSISYGKGVYRVGDKQVEAEIASALETMISIHTAPVSDDEMFGSDQRREVGATWTVNAAAIRRELDSFNAQGGVISGRASLERGSNSSLILKGWFEVKDLLIPISPEFDTEKGELRVQYSREIPSSLDQSRIETHSLHLSQTGSAKTNKPLILSIVMDQNGKYAVRPITSDKKDLSSSPD